MGVGSGGGRDGSGGVRDSDEGMSQGIRGWFRCSSGG